MAHPPFATQTLSADYEAQGKDVGHNGVPGVHGDDPTGLPAWLKTKPVADDDSAASKAGKGVWNFLVGGINVDIFDVRPAVGEALTPHTGALPPWHCPSLCASRHTLQHAD